MFMPLMAVGDAEFAEVHPGAGTGERRWLGVRQCPNVQCKEPFAFYIRDGKQVLTLPSIRTEVDLRSLPTAIADSFQEASVCRDQSCFRAAAIMIRRTLEELCEEKGAEGANLQARVAALKSVITVPPALLEAANELRILGNDAAHLEARAYDQIGAEEVDAGLALCRELLRAVYQMDDLVAKLQALKRSDPERPS